MAFLNVETIIKMRIVSMHLATNIHSMFSKAV